MNKEEDVYLRELAMLTGKVNKDKSYLFYLLIKDGTYFKKINKPVVDVTDDSTVDTFEDWFNNLWGDIWRMYFYEL